MLQKKKIDKAPILLCFYNIDKWSSFFYQSNKKKVHIKIVQNNRYFKSSTRYKHCKI